MSHSELAIAGLYDHEHETVREKQRRIPDWGGDDVFATTPRRRRFEHADERAREGGVRMRLRDTHEYPLTARSSLREAGLDDAPPLTAAPEAEAPVAEPAEAPIAADDPYLAPPEIAANGRRVVTITGHPGATRAHRPLDVAPRRPARTIDERIAHAPERIAMWAFALGLLLIVIAVATAN